MNNNEFTRVQTILKANFPKITMFNSPDSVDLVFNSLNRYEFQDTWQGVKDCVQNSQFAPTLREIIDSIERVEQNRLSDERRRNNARQTWNMAVRCTKCNDAGYVFVRHEDGTEAVMPCQCQAARDRFPSLFKTEEELQKWVEDERRKNRNPPTGKPGLSAEKMREYCGDVIEMAPGRKPPAPPRQY